MDADLTPDLHAEALALCEAADDWRQAHIVERTGPRTPYEVVCELETERDLTLAVDAWRRARRAEPPAASEPNANAPSDVIRHIAGLTTRDEVWSYVTSDEFYVVLGNSLIGAVSEPSEDRKTMSPYAEEWLAREDARKARNNPAPPRPPSPTGHNNAG